MCYIINHSNNGWHRSLCTYVILLEGDICFHIKHKEPEFFSPNPLLQNLKGRSKWIMFYLSSFLIFARSKSPKKSSAFPICNLDFFGGGHCIQMRGREIYKVLHIIPSRHGNFLRTQNGSCIENFFQLAIKSLYQ